MGFSATGTVIMLTLLMGMVKEDLTTAVGLSGKAKPDWKGVEDLLKNISGSRHPGEPNVKYYGEHVSKPTLKTFHAIFRANMHYVLKTCTYVSQTYHPITAIYGNFLLKF